MSTFRTIELSDPRFEPYQLRFLTVKTPNLRGRGDICVFVPEGDHQGQELPVVILLHGVYGSAWCWAFKTGVHLQVSEMIRQSEIPPMAIAMPSDGLWEDGSGYLPHNELNFEKWVIEDVPGVLKEHIKGIGKNSPLFICGLSMGGFGALRMGAKYGNQFKGIAAHSAITSLSQMKLFVEEDIADYEQKNKTDEDVFETIVHYRQNLPPIRFDCGREDELIQYNRQLHHRLEEQNINHDFAENTGNHEWGYWEGQIKKSFLFFGRQL